MRDSDSEKSARVLDLEPLQSSGKEPMPFALVIFGASGDLTRRKLIPAVFNLFRHKKIQYVLRTVLNTKIIFITMVTGHGYVSHRVYMHGTEGTGFHALSTATTCVFINNYLTGVILRKTL